MNTCMMLTKLQSMAAFHTNTTLSSPIQSAIHKHTRNPIPSFLKLSRFIMHRKVNLTILSFNRKLLYPFCLIQCRADFSN